MVAGVMSLFIFVIVLICGGLYSKGGMERIYALYIMSAVIVLLILNSIAIEIFNAIESANIPLYPWSAYQAFLIIPHSTTIYQTWILSYVITMASGWLGIVIAALARIKTPNDKVLGDAHFANGFEMKKTGFFNEEGIIVGKAWGKPLTVGGFEHVLVFSPAGSGKTTSIAIPNLLTWKDSCVVNDTKYELFELTSRYRKDVLNHSVFLWAPTRRDGKTHRYNPLKFISNDKTKRISDIQLMGHVLIPNGQGDPIWTQSSRELFLALVLFLLDSPEHATTFAELHNLSKQHHFNQWLEKLVAETSQYDAEFYRNASSYLNTGEKTRASILKTFTGYLEIFANPIINAATCDSDFDLRTLRQTKMTIYIGFPDNEKEMISPLLTLFWQQLISFMTERLPDTKQEPYPLLCLMDEFSTLGRLVNLKNSLKLLRGYRVRVLIIIQYLAQVLELYSQAEAESFKNIKTKVSFALDSYEDAEYLSKLLGNKTKRITAHSSTHHQEGSSSSRNHQLQSLPLMRPEAIMRMKNHDAIILYTGHPPIKAKQCRWYQEKSLKNLPCGEVDAPRQLPRIVPFERSVKVIDLSIDRLTRREKQLIDDLD